MVALTAAHLLLDGSGLVNSSALASLPVAALFVPVAYAALRYGLHGSAATAAWATLLWLPDLTVRHHHGDPATDAISLLLIDTVALIVGQRIEREHLARTTASIASSHRHASEARYRQLFAAAPAPILLFDTAGRVLDANPAAWAIFGSSVLEKTMQGMLGLSAAAVAKGGSGRVDLVVNDQPAEFRYLGSVATSEEGTQLQLLLHDVTAERRAWRDAQDYAAALLGAHEEERSALARELQRRLPALATAAWWKQERGQRVFVDYNQNARDRTVASAYSVRANPEGRVSCPLTWEEVVSVAPDDLTIATVPARFAGIGDPAAGIDDVRYDLQPLLELADRDEAGGLGDAPWPPHFAKQRGEPPRVAPGRGRRA